MHLKRRGIFGILLLVCCLNIQLTNGQQCSGLDILFNGACFAFTRGDCGQDNILIGDQCCNEHCVRLCSGINCLGCCHPRPQTSSTTTCQNPCQSQTSTQCQNSQCVQPSQAINCPTGGCNNCGTQSTQPCCQTTNCPTGGCNNCGTQSTQPCCQTINCPTGGCNNCATQCTQPGCQTINCPTGGCNNCGTPTYPPTNPPKPPIFPITTTTTEQPTIIPPTQPPTTVTPPRPHCPEGTILIGEYCQLLYCPYGTTMSNGKCIRIECPEGTMWTGSRCSLPEPITHNITINNKINTISEASRPNININYTNNLQVNAPVTINQEESNNSTDCEDDTVPTSPPRCCTVVTPRTCKKTYNRWHCYHTRNQMCGDFCEASTIYLRPPRPYSRPNLVIVPPCDTPNGQCGLMTGGYDCSGCAYGNGLGCPSYCNRYKCVPPRCAFCDQQTYCRHNFGSFGCFEDDGCFDSWCS